MQKPKNNCIYFDYNATAPMREAVKSACISAFDAIGNPSSVHQAGRKARQMVEEARAAVAVSVNVAPVQVIFTSGGTESNNTALSAIKANEVFVSAIEHDSIIQAAIDKRIVPVDESGVVRLDALKRSLKEVKPPFIVSLMLANNETGVIQPVEEAADIVHQAGGVIHCDAVQAYGKVAVDFAALKVDLMTLSAHKIGGPKGVGALIAREGLPLVPFLTGGGQERNRRAGTENVPAIAGFGVLADSIEDILQESAALKGLRDRLEKGLGLKVYGQNMDRLPNTSCLAGDVPAETRLMQLDLKGVAVSSGSACSSGKVTASHVLLAMGINEQEAACAIRVSLGWANGEEEVDEFMEIWKEV